MYILNLIRNGLKKHIQKPKIPIWFYDFWDCNSLARASKYGKYNDDAENKNYKPPYAQFFLVLVRAKSIFFFANYNMITSYTARLYLIKVKII